MWARCPKKGCEDVARQHLLAAALGEHRDLLIRIVYRDRLPKHVPERGAGTSPRGATPTISGRIMNVGAFATSASALLRARSQESPSDPRAIRYVTLQWPRLAPSRRDRRSGRWYSPR